MDPRIQRWIADQRWTELRDIQERSIPRILDRAGDTILSASTSAGKTEAAFLPILTHLLSNPVDALGAVYVSPLKALINDQFRRIELLCDLLDLPVYKWHGDVGAAQKKRALGSKNGLVLITPESLEAIFVRRGGEARMAFQALQYIVVDELHSFIGSERGQQLQSLLARIDATAGRQVVRIGLSATLGDPTIAARFLRPRARDEVSVLASKDEGRELLVQVRGYRSRENDVTTGGATADEQIARDLFVRLRGDKHLVFANARSDVESYADTLREMSEARSLPNEFFPHHGSLAKEIREDVESRLRDDPRPTTAVCTSTLEMGIDIKQVKSVAQLGAPFSVSSLRQRLGRSGRREGEPSILRFYIKENAVDIGSRLVDQIRADLFQAVAMIELVVARWCEPPREGALHLSTLIQQLLSVVVEHGGASEASLFDVLCEKGAFPAVDRPAFRDLLRELGRLDILSQHRDGTLILGLAGERIVHHHSFFAAFNAPEEFRVIAEGRPLGSMPVLNPIFPDTYLIFAGRRWRVVQVEPQQRLIVLTPAPGKKVPKFASDPGAVHARIREKMFELYTGFEIPRYLDRGALELFAEGRQNFATLELAERTVVRSGNDAAIFLWCGDRALHTLATELVAGGYSTEISGCSLVLHGVHEEAAEAVLRMLAKQPPADAIGLAATVPNKIVEKYDHLLPSELLCRDYASRALDVVGAREAVRRTKFRFTEAG